MSKSTAVAAAVTAAAKAPAKGSTAAVVAKAERLIRQLASVEERLEILKERGAGIRSTLFGLIKAHGDKIETVYGRVNLKKEKVYDYGNFADVKEAAMAVEEAKARLKAAQAAAQAAGAPHTVKETLVFNRNKAVSARAQSGRIYVRSFIRRPAS